MSNPRVLVILGSHGLSTSDAVTYSNRCNQLAETALAKLDGFSPISKTFDLAGKTYTTVENNNVDEGIVVETLEYVSRLRTVQGYLMSAIKIKNKLIKDNSDETFNEEIMNEMRKKDGLEPIHISMSHPTMKHISLVLPVIDESKIEEWLDENDLEEFFKNQALASTIGKFIHKDGTLDNIRKTLINTKLIEFIEIEDGKKTPVTVTKHQTPSDLILIHDNLAKLHREAEKKVNYYISKAKQNYLDVCNRMRKEHELLVLEEKERFQKKVDEYRDLVNDYNESYKKYQIQHQELIQNKERELYGLKIVIPKGEIEELLNELKD